MHFFFSFFQNLGTIKCSNLCTEIVEYTAPDEVAVCNLASIALNRFVTDAKFDFKALFEVTKVVTRNLNKIIDINYYPVPEVRPPCVIFIYSNTGQFWYACVTIFSNTFSRQQLCYVPPLSIALFTR